MYGNQRETKDSRVEEGELGGAAGGGGGGGGGARTV